MHEIRPRLWLGSYAAASDSSALAARGVTHVLTVGVKKEVLGARQRVFLPPSDKDPVSRLVICIQDTSSARLDKHFEACCTFIAEALAEGGSVLVHCHAGQSRSPTVVAAHLMREEHLSAAEAVDCIRRRRPVIQPNRGFLDQLRSFELRLNASQDADEAATPPASPVATAPLPHVGRGDEDTGKLEQEDAAAEASEADEDASPEGVPVAVGPAADVAVEGRAGRRRNEAVDIFGTEELRLRADKLRERYQQLRAASSLLTVAAPLRKRRHAPGRS